MSATPTAELAPPKVPAWQIWGLRLMFLAMVVVLGKAQWIYILGGTLDWEPWRGLGHSMLAALSLMAVLGVFHPIKMLPLMIYEVVWKATWLLAVALPAWLSGVEVPGIVSLYGSIIGIALITVLIPWRYVWWSYVARPVSSWRQARPDPQLKVT